MKAVLALVSILSGAQYAAADCSRLKQFETTLVPVCGKSELNIKWPNYADQSTYYSCSGVNSAVLMGCPQNEYFSYALQECGSCLAYIPPAPCGELKTAKTPICIPISAGNDMSTTQSLPTPKYPPSTPATVPPIGTTTNPQPSTTIKDTESSTPSDTTTFPAPPAMTTADPDIPQPPSGAPTPPSIEVTPPSIVITSVGTYYF